MNQILIQKLNFSKFFFFRCWNIWKLIWYFVRFYLRLQDLIFTILRSFQWVFVQWVNLQGFSVFEYSCMESLDMRNTINTASDLLEISETKVSPFFNVRCNCLTCAFGFFMKRRREIFWRHCYRYSHFCFFSYIYFATRFFWRYSIFFRIRLHLSSLLFFFE